MRSFARRAARCWRSVSPRPRRSPPIWRRRRRHSLSCPTRRGRPTMPDFSRRSIVTASALLLLVFNPPSQGKDVGPWDLDTLRRPPKVTTIERGKTLTSLYYEGEPYRGKPTRVFAYLAHPAKTGGK